MHGIALRRPAWSASFTASSSLSAAPSVTRASNLYVGPIAGPACRRFLASWLSPLRMAQGHFVGHVLRRTRSGIAAQAEVGERANEGTQRHP